MFRLATLVVTAAVIEVVAFVGSTALQRRAYFFYEPADVPYGLYLRVRDPLLGWSVGHSSDMVWDQVGSRVVPFAPNPFKDRALVSLYGDSWTWSWPVSSRHAYGNVLAERLGRRVNNFGICGYGTDQAYLRFAANATDRAPVVILGVLSENIMRNVCSFLDVIVPSGGYSLKPRFVLDDAGQLQFRPAPRLDHGSFPGFLQHPETILTDEFFEPVRMEFPFTLALARVATGYRFRAAIRREPRWAEFYSADHRTRALQVTTGIITRFVTEARARGQHPLVALFPAGEDLRYFEDTGRWVYQSLIDSLASSEVDVCHVGPAILAEMEGRDYSDLFTDNNLEEHPSVEGYALQAEIVAECLSELHAHALAKGKGDDHGEDEEDHHPGELPLEAESEEVH